MKATSHLIKLFAGALAIAGVAGAGTAHANPSNVTYLVTVSTSFGTSFTDCFSFDKVGTLTVGGYGPLTYTFQSRDMNKKKFQSVSPIASALAAGFSIEFNGVSLGHTTVGYLLANGNDEFGDSYIVSGPPVASCAAAARLPNSQYRPAS